MEDLQQLESQIDACPPEVQGALRNITQLLEEGHWGPVRERCVQYLKKSDLTPECKAVFEMAGHFAEAIQLYRQAEGDVRIARTEFNCQRALQRLEKALQLRPAYKDAIRLQIELEHAVRQIQVDAHGAAIRDYMNRVRVAPPPPADQSEAQQLLGAVWGRVGEIRQLDTLVDVNAILSQAQQQALLRDLPWPPKEKPKPDPALRAMSDQWQVKLRLAEGAFPEATSGRARELIDWLEENQESPPGSWELPGDLKGLEDEWQAQVLSFCAGLRRRLDAYQEKAGPSPEVDSVRARLDTAQRGVGEERLADLTRAVDGLPPPPDPDGLRKVIGRARQWASKPVPSALDSLKNLLVASIEVADQALQDRQPAQWLEQERSLEQVVKRFEDQYEAWRLQAEGRIRALEKRTGEARERGPEFKSSSALTNLLGGLRELDPPARPETVDALLARFGEDLATEVARIEKEIEAQDSRQREVRGRLQHAAEQLEQAGLFPDLERDALAKLIEQLSVSASNLDSTALERGEALCQQLEEIAVQQERALRERWQRLQDQGREVLEGPRELPPDLRSEIEQHVGHEAQTFADLASRVGGLEAVLRDASGRVERYALAKTAYAKARSEGETAQNLLWLEDRVNLPSGTNYLGEDRKRWDDVVALARTASEAKAGLVRAMGTVDSSSSPSMEHAAKILQQAARSAISAAERSGAAHESLAEYVKSQRSKLNDKVGGLTSLPSLPAEKVPAVQRARELLRETTDEGPPGVRKAANGVFEAAYLLQELEREYREYVESQRSEAQQLLKRGKFWQVGRVRFPAVRAEARRGLRDAKVQLEAAVAAASVDPGALKKAIGLAKQARESIPRNFLPAIAGAFAGLGVAVIVFANFVSRPVTFPYVPGYDLVGVRVAGSTSTPIPPDSAGQCELPYKFGRSYVSLWEQVDPAGSAAGESPSGGSNLGIEAPVEVRPWPIPLNAQAGPVPNPHVDRMKRFLQDSGL